LIDGFILVSSLAFAAFTAVQSVPAGDEKIPAKIQWLSFDDGLAAAKLSGKKILIDVYTDWCTWCKKMDKDVYPDTKVVELVSTKFIAIKLNAEGSRAVLFRGQQLTETQFARSARITGYPTTLFLESDGKPISIVPGYLPPEKFMQILNYFDGEHYKRGSFQDYLKQSPPKPEPLR
jgi:thioredoxin-related protein